MPDDSTEPQWSNDHQWWWDGSKWLPAAEAPAPAPTSPDMFKHQQRQAEEDRKSADKLAKAEAKRVDEEQKKAQRQAKLDEMARRKGKMAHDGSLPMDKLHGRAKDLLTKSLGPGEPVLAQINGVSDIATLVLTDRRALIIKVGWRTGQTLGGKVTSFDYRNITSVEVRASIVTGSFEISAGGVQGPERSYWATGKGGSWEAPNIIPITKKEEPTFQRVATFIRERVREANQPAAVTFTPPPIDIPDQLRKLAELKNQGILTEAEFEAKKTDLLARL